MVFVTLLMTPPSPIRVVGISSVLAASIPSRTERAMTLPALMVAKAAAAAMIWEAFLMIVFIKSRN